MSDQMQDVKAGYIKNIVAWMTKMKAEINTAIPSSLKDSIDAERIIRVTKTTLQFSDERVWKCDPLSICACVVLAAQHGLELNNEDAYLTPRKNKQGKLEANFSLGYKGYLKLMWRAGCVSKIEARAVFQNDEFSFEYGTNQFLKHKPFMDGDPGELQAAYAFAISNGEYQFEVCDKRFLDKIRNQSDAKSAYSPWAKWPEQMAKKTAIRQIIKVLPTSNDIQELSSIDGVGESDQLQDLAKRLNLQEIDKDYSSTPAENNGDQNALRTKITNEITKTRSVDRLKNIKTRVDGLGLSDEFMEMIDERMGEILSAETATP